jgi:hypothetical protein
MAFNLLCRDGNRNGCGGSMKYFVAWMLGVPLSLVVLWFVGNQVGC